MAKDPDILDVCGAVPGDESLIIKQFRELGGDALISAAGSVPSGNYSGKLSMARPASAI